MRRKRVGRSFRVRTRRYGRTDLRNLMIVAVGSLALGACATLFGGGPDRELAGERQRLQSANGQSSTLRFRGDGTVVAQFGERAVTGRWQIEGRELCFYWTGAPRECWPYERPFREGETRTLTSTRGNRVVVTSIS